MGDRLEPFAVLIELAARDVLVRREGERDPVVAEVNPLCLRDGEAIQRVLVRTDFRQELVFQSPNW